MSGKQVAIVGIIAATLAGAPKTAAADPIIIDMVIASGRFHASPDSGTAGLVASGSGVSLALDGGARIDCGEPCPVGGVTNSLSFSGITDVSTGLVTIGDKTFDLPQTGGGEFTYSSASFAYIPGVPTYTMPFTLTGFIRIMSGSGEDLEEFEIRVSGSGTATGTYELVDFPEPERDFLILDDLSVNFGRPAPPVVPEPSSILLLGTGVAGLIVRTARRRERLPRVRPGIRKRLLLAPSLSTDCDPD